VAWLREIHRDDTNVTVTGIADDLPMDLNDDALWRGHVALMQRAVAELGVAEPVDTVFTSEGYGDELARRLGARHAAIDGARALVPCSGTAVRQDPSRHWQFLDPCVRADLTRRVVLVGAESTGKTTLAEALTQQLRARGGAFGETRCVLEYGREYTLEKLAAERGRAAVEGRAVPDMEALRWESPEFELIARRQRELEHAAARAGGPLLICDTDAFATAIWHERYVGTRAAANLGGADAEFCAQRLYLLTHPDDVPFVQDGVRDGVRVRHAMTDCFVARLQQSGRRWQWLRGERAAREQRALAILDELLSSDLGLAPPDVRA
jgi:NadR type nicotinamide-nucleotide adenylyltransferase